MKNPLKTGGIMFEEAVDVKRIVLRGTPGGYDMLSGKSGGKP
jgi:hypothetical protein